MGCQNYLTFNVNFNVKCPNGSVSGYGTVSLDCEARARDTEPYLEPPYKDCLRVWQYRILCRYAWQNANNTEMFENLIKLLIFLPCFAFFFRGSPFTSCFAISTSGIIRLFSVNRLRLNTCNECSCGIIIIIIIISSIITLSIFYCHPTKYKTNGLGHKF